MKLSKNQGALGLSNKQNEIFIDIKNQVYMTWSRHSSVSFFGFFSPLTIF